MDRINKFLKQKQNKNIIKLKDKEIELKKADYKKIKKFKQNYCLDSINMYEPLNCKFSRDTMKEGLVRHKKHRTRTLEERKIKKLRERREIKKVESNVIADLWSEQKLDINNLHAQNIEMKFPQTSNSYNFNGQMSIDSLKYDDKEVEAFLNKLEDKHFKPKKISKYKLEDLIPKKVDLNMVGLYPSEIAKIYRFEENLNNFIINNNYIKAFVSFTNKVIAFDCKIFRKSEFYDFEGKVTKLIHSNGCLLVAVNDKIKIFGSKKIERSENRFVNFINEENGCIIEHKNRIIDMDMNYIGNYLAVISGKKVLIHNLKDGKTIQPVKLHSENPLRVKFHPNKNIIVISTTTSLIVFDLSKKCLELKHSGELSHISNFVFLKKPSHIKKTEDSFNLLISNNTQKLMLFNLELKKTLKCMEQKGIVRELCAHRNLNLFCATFHNEMILFNYEIGETINIYILKVFKGSYLRPTFHMNFPWLYAIHKNEVILFT